MSFPTNLTILDRFNRANENPLDGGNWLGPLFLSVPPDLSLVLQSNAVITTSSSVTSESYWNTSSFGPNAEVWLTMTTCFTDQGVALYLAVVSPDTSGVDGYFVVAYIFSGVQHCEIYRIDNNVTTMLGASLLQTFNDGDKLGFEQIGDQLTAYLNTGSGWNSLMQRQDGTYNTGFIGMSIDRPGAVLDDFGGGTVLVNSLTAALGEPTIGSSVF